MSLNATLSRSPRRRDNLGVAASAHAISDPRRKRSDLLWSALEGGGSAGLAVLSTIIVARLLGPADFGIIMSIFTLVQVGAYFAENTFNDAIVRQADLDVDHATTAYAASVAIGAVLAALFAAAHAWIADFFGAPGLDAAVVLAGLTLVLNGVCSVPMSLLRRDLRFRALALRTIYARLAGTVAVAVALLLGFGVWAVVIQNLVGGAVNVACLVPLMRRATRGRVTRRALLDLLPVSIFTSTTMLLAVVAQRVFLVLISLLFGPLALGLYMIGLRTVEVIRTLLQNATKQLLYRRMALRQSDPTALRALYLSVTQLGAAVTLPIFVGMYLCAPQIIAIFLQPQWQGAVGSIRGFCIASAIFSVRMFDGLVYTSLGRAQVNLLIAVSSIAAFVVTLFVLYATGLGAPVDAMIAHSTVATLISVPLIANALDLRLGAQFRGLAPILASVALMAVAVLWLEHAFLEGASPLRGVAVMAPTGAAIYSLALLLLAPATFRQILAIAQGR